VNVFPFVVAMIFWSSGGDVNCFCLCGGHWVKTFPAVPDAGTTMC
jgi:hypothetical protein